MRNYIKAAKLDILSMGIPWLCLITVYSSFFTILLGVFNLGFPIMCIGGQVMTMFAVVSPFLFQERDKLTLLYGTLPLRIKDIVQGRYLYIVFISGTLFIKDIIIYTCFVLIRGQSFDFMTIIQGLTLSLFILAINSTIIPPLYKFGLMKGVAFFAVIFFIIIIGFGLLVGTEALSHLLMFCDSHLTVFLLCTILISSIILYISYQIAITAYRKRCWI